MATLGKEFAGAADKSPGPHSSAAEQSQAASFFQEFLDHSTKTWNDARHLKATPSEYLEDGVEIVGLAVAARYGINC